MCKISYITTRQSTGMGLVALLPDLFLFNIIKMRKVVVGESLVFKYGK